MPDEKFTNIYYLGPDGSNCHNALLKYIDLCSFGVENKIAKKSIKSVLEAFENDKNSICVLPIENSIEGIVRETIDNFMRLKDKQAKIQGEITLPIRHMLLSKSNDKNKIKIIMSHPQALSQCGNYLWKNYPDAELKEVSSTSYAAQKVSAEEIETIAAIANEACARLFGLNIIENDINDEPDNKTRFYIIGRNNLSYEESDKIALILSTKNHSGALCEVLKIFAKHNINITYIDSRPSKKKLGEYLFFMELEGYNNHTNVDIALEDVKNYVDFIKILGSFKIYK